MALIVSSARSSDNNQAGSIHISPHAAVIFNEDISACFECPFLNYVDKIVNEDEATGSDAKYTKTQRLLGVGQIALLKLTA